MTLSLSTGPERKGHQTKEGKTGVWSESSHARFPDRSRRRYAEPRVGVSRRFSGPDGPRGSETWPRRELCRRRGTETSRCAGGM